MTEQDEGDDITGKRIISHGEEDAGEEENGVTGCVRIMSRKIHTGRGRNYGACITWRCDIPLLQRIIG